MKTKLSDSPNFNVEEMMRKQSQKWTESFQRDWGKWGMKFKKASEESDLQQKQGVLPISQ